MVVSSLIQAARKVFLGTPEAKDLTNLPESIQEGHASAVKILNELKAYEDAKLKGNPLPFPRDERDTNVTLFANTLRQIATEELNAPNDQPIGATQDLIDQLTELGKASQSRNFFTGKSVNHLGLVIKSKEALEKALLNPPETDTEKQNSETLSESIQNFLIATPNKDTVNPPLSAETIARIWGNELSLDKN